MAQYRLLAGLHYQRDMEAEGVPILDTNGNQAVDLRTKEPLYRYPSKKYEPGQLVESDIDLVERFGTQKFAYVGEPPTKAQRQKMQKDKGVQAPAKDTAFQVHPAGQVLEGHQQTTTPEPGKFISGRADENSPAFQRMVEEAEKADEEKQEQVEKENEERAKAQAKGAVPRSRAATTHHAATTTPHKGTAHHKGTTKKDD